MRNIIVGAFVAGIALIGIAASAPSEASAATVQRTVQVSSNVVTIGTSPVALVTVCYRGIATVEVSPSMAAMMLASPTGSFTPGACP